LKYICEHADKCKITDDECHHKTPHEYMEYSCDKDECEDNDSNIILVQCIPVQQIEPIEFIDKDEFKI